MTVVDGPPLSISYVVPPALGLPLWKPWPGLAPFTPVEDLPLEYPTPFQLDPLFRADPFRLICVDIFIRLH